MSTHGLEVASSADTPAVSSRLARPTRVFTDETQSIAVVGGMHEMLAAACRVHRVQVLCGSCPEHSGSAPGRRTV
jgi:hypothetical protein